MSSVTIFLLLSSGCTYSSYLLILSFTRKLKGVSVLFLGPVQVSTFRLSNSQWEQRYQAASCSKWSSLYHHWLPLNHGKVHSRLVVPKQLWKKIFQSSCWSWNRLIVLSLSCLPLLDMKFAFMKYCLLLHCCPCFEGRRHVLYHCCFQSSAQCHGQSGALVGGRDSPLLCLVPVSLPPPAFVLQQQPAGKMLTSSNTILVQVRGESSDLQSIKI